MHSTRVQERFVTACKLPGTGRRHEHWGNWQAALLARFQGYDVPDSCILPEGYVFSLDEQDEGTAVTPSVLETVFLHCVEDARKTGSVYTPGFMVRWMVQEALARWMDGKLSDVSRAALLRQVRVLDMSTGCGAFTMGVLQELLRLRMEAEPDIPRSVLVRSIIEHQIYGVDINPEALEVARTRFRCALLAVGDAASFTDHLVHGDSLEMGPESVWERDFASVLLEGGFDLVIGNPPFIGEKGNRALFERLKRSVLASYCSLRMDYWYVFACLGMDMLKTGGMMHMIVPNKWMTNEGASLMRSKWVNESVRLNLTDFGACHVFGAARVHTMTVLAEKGGGGKEMLPEYRRFIGGGGLKEFLEQAPYDGVCASSSSQWVKDGLFFCGRREQGILEKMEQGMEFILNPLTEMAQGIVPNPDVLSPRSLGLLDQEVVRRDGLCSGDGVFVVPSGYFEDLPSEERFFLKPLYEPFQASRYALKCPQKELLYLTPSNGSEAAVTLTGHLKRFAPLMEARRENRLGRLKYYHLHWPRNERFFLAGPKILVSRKCARPAFTYTEREAYVMMGFNVIRTERMSMKYLSALFNSRLMHFWFRFRGKMQGDFFQLDTAPVLRAPIRVPSASCLQEIEKLVDLLCIRYQEEDDARIDELIEALYGISDTESIWMKERWSERNFR